MFRVIVCFLLLITEVYAEQRVALVIGNCLYDPTKSLEDDKSRNLPNACKDALLIKESLVGKKFEVLYRENLNTQELKQALIDFKNALPKGAIGWFYYAGHAMQHESINYLIPVRTEINCDLLNSELLKTVAVQDVLNEMQGKNIAVKIIQLDACRDNPLEKCPLRSTFNTLASMNNVPQGSIIGFSTAPGTRAFDASGYAKEIALAIQEYSHLPVEQMLKQAHKKISSQTSWLHTSVSGNDLCLDQCEEVDKAKILQVELQEKEKILQERDKIIFELKQQVSDAQKNQVNPQILIDLMKRLETLENKTPPVLQPVEMPKFIVKSTPKIGENFKDCLDCPEMVMLAGGTFKMGSEKGDPDEKPVHSVTIKPFAMGKYEITTKEYMLCVNDKKCPLPKWLEINSEFNIKSGTKNDYKAFVEDSQPIVGVSWLNAIDYTKWLSEKTSKKYRLPSESEWEYAVRANTKAKNYGFDGKNSDINEYAWYNKNSNGKTHPIGQKKPNAFGLYDMHGNVWEWVQDTWHSNYNDASVDGSAWETTNESSDRVLRGGSWFLTEKDLRSANRNNFPSNERKNSYGFRVACCS